MIDKQFNPEKAKLELKLARKFKWIRSFHTARWIDPYDNSKWEKWTITLNNSKHTSRINRYFISYGLITTLDRQKMILEVTHKMGKKYVHRKAKYT